MKCELDLSPLFNVSYGLYIITSHLEGKGNGLVANTVCQVTADPPRVSVCIHKENFTHDYIMRSRSFAVSVLEEDTPLKFIGIFGFNSGRNFDKLAKVEYEFGKTGCPLVTEHALGVFEVTVMEQVDAGTHTIFVGEVVSARTVREGKPLTYRYYRTELKGKTPKYAPTFMGMQGAEKVSDKERSGTMKKYVCDICGYVYDPADGDPDNGVDPGTPFEELPDDWVCPVCGAGKDQFSPEE